MANQANPRKRWDEKGIQGEGLPSKKPTNMRPKP